MIDDENEKRRTELCDRFRQSLTRPVSERFFDEDELVDLFDYAGDLGDDYLKMEVLLCGARLYPDSDLLRQRRAIFYTFLSDDAAAKFLDDNPAENSPIWEIMRLRSRAPQGDDARRALRYLVDGVERFDDEEVIQLVDLASSLGVYDWLVDNETLLRSKTDYLPILLYELAVVSELNHNYPKAILYLEELTEAEPFSAYYWYMLAQDYDMLDRREQALQAVDYSLAIDGEGKDALQLRARILMQDEATRPQALEIIRRLADRFPDDIDVQRALAYISILDADIASLHETMRKCLERFPGDRAVLNDIIGTGLGDLPSMLDSFYAHTDERDEDTWLDWADELRSYGYFEEASMVIEAFIRNNPEGVHDISILLDCLFFLKRFPNICAILDLKQSKYLFIGHDRFAHLVIFAISLAKCGKAELALSMMGRMLDASTLEQTCTADMMQRITAMGVKLRIEQQLKKKNPDWDSFDPLCHWILFNPDKP